MKKIIFFLTLVSLSLNASSSICDKVLEIIHQSLERDELSKTWEILIRGGVLEVRGRDKEVRPCFVKLQGIVESVLAHELQHEIKSLMGIIHTPMPATPLCTTDEISKEPTVIARAKILRDYLSKGGDLFIVYPRAGLMKRTLEQRKFYAQELKNYPNHLFDVPLNCENIPKELIGATYIFKDSSDNSYLFSIKITQVNDPQELGDFGLWFGPIDHPSIQNRFLDISDFLEKNRAI